MNDDYGTLPNMWAKRIIPLLVVIVVILCSYLVVSAIITAETTGVLKVSSTQKANIIVGRDNGQARIIGNSDHAGVRLKPGKYWVEAATNNGQVAVRTVSIDKKKSAAVSLAPANSSRLPSINDISFNMSGLLSHGVSSDQINVLEYDFFHFKPTAGSVTVNTQSVRTLPHNLGDPFVLTFSVMVDSKAYNAKVSYEDPQNIRLQLYDAGSGKLVYDSRAVSSSNILD